MALSPWVLQADPHGKPKHTAHDLAEFFENSGRKIFQKTVWRNIRSAGGVLDERYWLDPWKLRFVNIMRMLGWAIPWARLWLRATTSRDVEHCF